MADSISSNKHRQRFEEFLNVTAEERRRAEKRRDYRDLKQWTAKQIATLEGRKQAAIVFDQYSQKVDAICGLEIQGRTDPKALPVHPKEEAAAEAITDGLRYVESKQDLDDTFSDCFEDKIVEGYDAIITEVQKKKREFEIQPKRIPWDRVYFDPYSRNRDFSDSSFFGITLWMDLDDAIALNPSKKDSIKHVVQNGFDDETFADRPGYWTDSKRKRIRVNQEFYEEKGRWKEIFFSGDLVIIEPKDSSYLDEDGIPMCPIEMDCDYVDRENNRWGYMQRLIDVQDEINHRRSKALHMLSRKKVIASQGAFLDKSRSQVLQELAKAEAYLETAPNAEVNIDDNQDLGAAQLELYRDATVAMDSVGTNPELSGRTTQAVSGRAYIARQQSGMTELAGVFARHSNFKKRVYRQIWLRMRQFWSEEKWIRVSDNKNAMRFIGLNVPIRAIEKQLEMQSGMSIDAIKAQDERISQAIEMQIQQNPLLGQVVEIRNNVKKLDMDITLEEGPDTATIQQEQFDTIANLAGTRADPAMFKALVMLSSMANKKEVLELFEGNEQDAMARAEAEQQAQQIQMAQIQSRLGIEQAEIQKTQAETQKILSEIPLNAAKTRDEMASAAERVKGIVNPQ